MNKLALYINQRQFKKGQFVQSHPCDYDNDKEMEEEDHFTNLCYVYAYTIPTLHNNPVRYI